MRKYRGLFAVLAAAAMLTACADSGLAEQGGNTSAASGETVTTTSAATTTAAITTTAETTAAAPTTTVSPSFTLAVIPANEVYEEYPKKIIYPEEKTEIKITAETVTIDEDLYNPNGVNVCSFGAACPVFSGGDETVMGKINENIKKYMESRLEEAREEADNNHAVIDPDKEEDFTAMMTDRYGSLSVAGLSEGSSAWNEEKESFYTVCGNVLSVRFTDSSYSWGAVHDMYGNITLNYDLRTGERIDFNDYVSDVKGLKRKFYRETLFFCYLYKSSFAYHEKDIEEFVNEKLAEAEERDFYTNGGKYFDEYDTVTGNGCVGIYLEIGVWGSYADGVRIVEIPIDEVLPYLTDEGRALFEGAVSAKTEPLNVIEYKGKRYIDTASYIPEFEYSALTDSDYEFMALFPNANELKFRNCRNIDFEKIAAMKNIRTLYLYDCEFDDISPLFGSNVNSLNGSGNNISKEQADEFMKIKMINYISPDLIKMEDNND